MSSLASIFKAALEKQAEEASFLKASTLPSFNQQAKWQYAKYPHALQLHNPVDGKTYHFDLPEGQKDDDQFTAFRSSDKSTEEFGKDADKKGLAQVHRSAPDNLYFTLQEGTKNPTYTLKHHEGQTWHGIPKKHKLKAEIERVFQTKQALEPGYTAPWYDPVAAAGKGFLATAKGFGHIGDSPLASTLIGAGGGLAYDQLKRNFYNTDEENQNETIGERAKRIALPAVGLGGLGLLLHTGLGDYYKKQQPYQQQPESAQQLADAADEASTQQQ